MEKYMRWTALLAALILVLAACQPGTGDDASPGTGNGGTGEDPSEVCDADEFGCLEIAEGDPLLFATALSITGDTASLGLDSVYGAKVAAQFINDEGGVFGREIEVIDEDAGCGQAETGQTAAQSLVTNENLVIAFGTSCSRTAVTAAPILAQQGIVLFSPSNTSPTLTDPEHAEWAGEFYLRTAHSDLVAGATMASYACEQGFTTAATMHDGSTYADNLRLVFESEFEEQCDGEIVAQEAVSVGETQFSDRLAPIADAAPDIFFYPIFHPEGTLITQQARDLSGLDDTLLASADALLGLADLVDQAGEAAEGMVFSGPGCVGEEYENTFLPAYREVSGEADPISVFHCHAFDAVNIAVEALEQVGIEGDDGTLYIPRQGFRDALFATENHQGLTGNLTCSEFGECSDPNIVVWEIQNGEYVIIWPEG